MSKELKIDYARKIAEAVFPEGENLTSIRVGSFIIHQMKKTKSELKCLNEAAKQILINRRGY